MTLVMTTKNRKPDHVTTLQLPAIDRDEVKAIAHGRGLKMKYTPGIMAEGWKLLTPDQIATACERYASRRPRRLAKTG